jgi:hypothetical protein
MEATGTHSATSSYEDARQSRAAEIERTLETLKPMPMQAGLAVVRDGRVVMLDVFGSPALFARAFKKCVRGALGELAASTTESNPKSATELVEQALRTLAHIEPTRAASPADGDTWTGSTDSLTYTACVWKGAVYHCAAAG